MSIKTILTSLLPNKNIKISIIVPVYNADKYLKKCLDSILIQKLNNIEIIAINDCSTDNSLDILLKYQKICPSLTVINHTVNKGAGVARKTAIKKAQGDYITFIDSDDWFSENYLISLYKEAEKTNADIVFSNMMTVEQNTKHKYAGFSHAMKKYQNTDNTLTELPCDWTSTAPWMKLFRRAFVNKKELKFLEGIKLGAEDIPFSWTAYFTAKKISFCEDAYYYYNLIPESLDRCINENIIEIFDALSFTKNEFQRFDPDHLRQIQLDTLYVSHIYYQFSKLTKTNTPENIKIASRYWDIANEYLSNISKDSIINNIYLNEQKKEYYYDVIKHPKFRLDMQEKYLAYKIN